MIFPAVSEYPRRRRHAHLLHQRITTQSSSTQRMTQFLCDTPQNRNLYQTLPAARTFPGHVQRVVCAMHPHVSCLITARMTLFASQCSHDHTAGQPQLPSLQRTTFPHPLPRPTLTPSRLRVLPYPQTLTTLPRPLHFSSNRVGPTRSQEPISLLYN